MKITYTMVASILAFTVTASPVPTGTELQVSLPILLGVALFEDRSDEKEI